VGDNLRTCARNDGGFTLVELLVAMTILGFVLAGVYQGLNNLTSTATEAEERIVNLDEARILMATVTKDLRTATRLESTASPFVYADQRKIIFHANINTNTGPNLVTVFVDGTNQFVEQTVTPNSGSCPSCTYTGTGTTRVVGRWIANPTSQPIFRFFDGTNVEVAAPLSDPLEAGDPTELAVLRTIESVEVNLSIRRTQTIGSKGTTIINRVRLPNVDYNPPTS
jgi:prepilin-type N-terminal cleavage/methylation domain-containing protein